MNLTNISNNQHTATYERQAIDTQNTALMAGTRALVMTCLSVLILVGCGKAEHEPVAGDYGETLVNSIRLTKSQIEELNNSAMPKPSIDDGRPEVSIRSDADAADNPYRYVMVARGTAIDDGEVDMSWFGGISVNGGMSPTVYIDEDSHNYDAGEPVLLVIASDPFSVNNFASKSNLAAKVELSKRENFNFDSMELQIWQGKGSKYSMTYYLSFLVILLLVFTFIYRAYSRLTGR